MNSTDSGLPRNRETSWNLIGSRQSTRSTSFRPCETRTPCSFVTLTCNTVETWQIQRGVEAAQVQSCDRNTVEHWCCYEGDQNGWDDLLFKSTSGIRYQMSWKESLPPTRSFCPKSSGGNQNWGRQQLMQHILQGWPENCRQQFQTSLFAIFSLLTGSFLLNQSDLQLIAARRNERQPCLVNNVYKEILALARSVQNKKDLLKSSRIYCCSLHVLFYNP